MMQVEYKSANGRLTFKFEATSIKDVFRRLSEIQEVLEQRCIIDINGEQFEASELHYVVRQVSGDEFFEVKSVGNDPTHGYRLDFKRTQDGRIFPKKRSRDGVQLSNDGWYKYENKQITESHEEKPF